MLNVVGILPTALTAKIAYGHQMKLQYFSHARPYTHQLMRWPPGAASQLVPGLGRVPGVHGDGGDPRVEVVGWANADQEVVGPSPNIFSPGSEPSPNQTWYMQSLRQFHVMFPAEGETVYAPRKMPGNVQRSWSSGVPGVPGFETPQEWAPSSTGPNWVEKCEYDRESNELVIMGAKPESMVYVEDALGQKCPLVLLLNSEKNLKVHLWHCSLISPDLVELGCLPFAQWKKAGRWWDTPPWKLRE